MSPAALLALSCSALCGLGWSAFAVLQHQRRAEQSRKRFATVLEPHALQRARVLPPLVLAAQVETDRSWSTRLLRLFGINRARTAHLPVRWYVLLASALLIARGLVIVVEMVLGSIGLLFWPLLWVFTSRFMFGWFARRHMNALLKQFPDALAMIVRSVRIGIPVTQAVGLVVGDAPPATAAEFARLNDALSIGKPMEEAMLELAERNGLAEYRFFAAALSLQNQTGGGLAATLENLADVIRKRVHARARGFALAAEARMSATVLTALPVFTFFALLVIAPAYIKVLMTTSGGHKVFGAALAMLGFGQFSMKAMIRRSLG